MTSLEKKTRHLHLYLKIPCVLETNVTKVCTTVRSWSPSLDFTASLYTQVQGHTQGLSLSVPCRCEVPTHLGPRCVLNTINRTRREACRSGRPSAPHDERHFIFVVFFFCQRSRKVQSNVTHYLTNKPTYFSCTNIVIPLPLLYTWYLVYDTRKLCCCCCFAKLVPPLSLRLRRWTQGEARAAAEKKKLIQRKAEQARGYVYTQTQNTPKKKTAVR